MLREDKAVAVVDKSPNELNVKDFKLFLFDNGAKSFLPACSTWKHCLALEGAEGDSVYFLFRKNGLDIKYFYSGEAGVSLTPKGTLSFRGGRTYSKSYKVSLDNVHAKCFYIAKSFINGDDIWKQLMSYGRVR